MIVSKIIGGLGNQLFQYAIGRSLAEQTNRELYLDVSGYETYRRPYALNHFNIKSLELSEADLNRFNRYRTRYSIPRLVESIKPMSERIYRAERQQFSYDPEVMNPLTTRDVYLDGYWQNENYFSGIRDSLIKEITLRERGSAITNLLKKINESESIAVHFRRGDDQLNKMYGTPPLEYYSKAISTANEKLGGKDTQVFIFANEDTQWIKEHFLSPTPYTFVSLDHELSDVEEFEAMKSCKHQIIANSTFSWWAAWLNNNKGKMVFAPKPWFLNTQQDINETGFIIPTWIRF